MAQSATVYRIQIELSDVDRGVYEALDLRLGRHPSETMRYLLTRVIAYCLCYEEGIAFTKGLSTNDEPAIWVRDLQGALRVWIEVGTPSAERLHKASKASPRLVVFTYADPELLQEAARAKAIYKADRLEIFALDPAFLDALDAITDRNAKWTLVHTEGMVYVTSGTESLSTPVVRHTLTG
ncbi:MAG TPA: YaeQ family protein [Polyangia bacterium]|nr:YaeQ family protein [Polyangia bacterium]